MLGPVLGETLMLAGLEIVCGLFLALAATRQWPDSFTVLSLEIRWSVFCSRLRQLPDTFPHAERRGSIQLQLRTESEGLP